MTQPEKSLVTHASSVSHEEEKQPYDYGKNKRLRHTFRRVSGNLLPKERVGKCGQRTTGSLVSFHSEGGRSHFGGLETCGSVWHCPVCAAKITEGRRVEIDTVLKRHAETGGFSYMATFTMPHNRFQTAKELRDVVANAWRKVKQGKKWVENRDKAGWVGDIRALEATHGQNGWHPHIHVLILFHHTSDTEAAENLGEWMFSKWQSIIEKMEYGIPARHVFRFDRVTEEGGAADYVGKWGVSHELTKAHTKVSKGGRSPWQILKDFAEKGEKRDAALFKEYGEAFKGARQLTWSRGLRDLYLDEPEKTDEDLSQEEISFKTHKLSIHKEVFRIIARRGKTAETLLAYDKEGQDGVLRLLNRLQIPWRIEAHLGLDIGRMVPLIRLR